MAQPQTIVQLLARGAPGAAAIGAPGRAPLIYDGLRRQIARTVETLNALGLGRGDRLAIVLPNGPEMATAFLAVAACATAAPLNPAYTADEFDFYLADLGVRGLIVQAGVDSPVREVARRSGLALIELHPADADAEAGRFTLVGEDSPPVSPAPASPGLAGPDDVALLLHTSGTTSRPKIVPLLQRNVCQSALNVAGTLQLTADDRCLNVMPLFHIHGLIAAVMASLAGGGGVFCCPPFSGRAFFDWMAAAHPTWYTAVPTMHQIILARAAEPAPSSAPDLAADHAAVITANPLRLIRSSSSSLPPSVMAELERVFGAPVIESYGMTEAAHQMASNPLPPLPRKPGTVGLAAGPELAIMDDAGTLLPAGTTGEIVIRGPNVTAGYESNPEANAVAFHDGWFRTGDQGAFDPDGYLTITGRLKEIINRGGEKISPREVDEVLLTHPAVAQAVTFALPAEILGEEVAAAIVLREGSTATTADIQAFAAERLAKFKVPVRLEFLDEIPKGPTGKLQRIGLAQKLGLA